MYAERSLGNYWMNRHIQGFSPGLPSCSQQLVPARLGP
jgi:hypothetical protein